MRIVALAGLLLIRSAADAQQKQAHPGYPPTMLLASASEQKGKVVIQMSRPGLVLPPDDGKARPGDRSMTEWVPLRKVMLGDTVQAFGVDGELVGPKAVLKALAEPKGVVVFIRSYANDPPTPAPFYRTLIREGTIILVVRADDIYNPKPAPPSGVDDVKKANQHHDGNIEGLLTKLEKLCQKMLVMQIVVNDGTKALHKVVESNPDKKARPKDKEISVNLAEKQKAIIVEAKKAIEMLKADPAVAFPEAFDGLLADMKRVHSRLEMGDVAMATQGIVQDIVVSLREMVTPIR
jgi:hypothetical protein